MDTIFFKTLFCIQYFLKCSDIPIFVFKNHKNIMINLQEFSFLDLLIPSSSQIQPVVVFNIVDNNNITQRKSENYNSIIFLKLI